VEEVVRSPKKTGRQHGFTLMELIVVMAVVAVLVVVAVPFFFDAFSSRLKTSAQNLAEDLRFAQNEAVRQGESNPAAGTFRARKVFVVFDTATNSYAIWRWEDTNGSNTPNAGEFNPDLGGVAGSDAPVRTGRLDADVRFTIMSGVNKAACGNGATPPASGVTLPAVATIPCSGKPCIRFDGKGFFENAAADNAVYLTDDNQSFAIDANRAGLFRFCKWDRDNASANPTGPSWVLTR
jgi:prepilin-type N-terminal cleavage/methylation domain-containing protein